MDNAQIRTVSPELIFGALFDRIGFNKIPDELFRHLVIARLAYPTSKLKTVDYLHRYKGITVSVQTLYRSLDKLGSQYQQQVEDIAFEYTKRILKGNVSIVFYDLTTLYFEAEDQDDLRKIGFSKDGKFHKPQIMLRLLVGKNGYPIGYDIFQGNTFEGHTLLTVLKRLEKKYDLEKPILIADAALLSKDNLKLLTKEGYQYIVAARMKNESDKLKQTILKKGASLSDGESFSHRKTDGTRLVVSFSEKRRKKDVKNRKRGLKKLSKKVKSGKLTKSNLNNRGYNKFLKLKGEVEIAIDQDKIKQDKRWDGLKGYITNTRLWSKTIIKNYSYLWQIERAFRISKTDLRIRPIYHYRKRRIEAHICIAFAAYTIYKELERLLHKHNAGMSAKRAGELTHTMYAIEYTLPHSVSPERIILKMDKDQRKLYQAIHD